MNKKCPYCGRKIDYTQIFSCKKKGIFMCKRCKKESKVKVDKKILILFLALCLLMVLFILLWSQSKMVNSIWGTVIVAVLMLAFYLCSPLFVSFAPLKKYTKDDISPKIYDSKDNTDTVTDSTFVFDKEAFDRIKREKEAGIILEKEEPNASTRVSEKYVPIIENVKEAHSSSDEPLQKIERPQRIVTPQQEYLYMQEAEEQEKRKKKKTNGTRYTANRRF